MTPFRATLKYFLCATVIEGLICPFTRAGTVIGWGDATRSQGPVPPQGLSNTVALAAGGYHSLALRNDATVVGWGNNYYGQASPPAGLTNVVSVSAGWQHSLALKSDGTVVGWGENTYGESTVSANVSNVITIAAGGWSSLALKSDGSLVAWGNEIYGMADVQPALTNIVALSIGSGGHVLVLRADGTVIAWGNNNGYGGVWYYGQATVPSDLSNVVAIAAGGWHSLALKRDGTVVGWGGLGFNAGLVPAGLSNVVAIGAGEYYSLALKSDGTVTAWGDYFDGGWVPMTVPAQAINLNFIAGGASHAVALQSDGSPALIRQPRSQTTYIGLTGEFDASATGILPLAYQWQHNGVDIPGATDVQLILSNLQTNDAGQYTIVVSNSLGFALSTNALLSVLPHAPIIVRQPSDQSVLVNSNVVLSVQAAGTAVLAYQWHFNGVDLPGATSSILSLPGITPTQAGLYTVTITNELGSVTSQPANLLVYSTPVIVEQPTNRAALVGTPTVFAVSAQSVPPLSYQWQFNGMNIPGATNATFSIPAVSYADAGTYQVICRNPMATQISDPAVLSVLDGRPLVVAQPTNFDGCVGGAAAFQVHAGGTMPLTYYWQRNDVPLSDAGNIYGAHLPVLQLTNLILNDSAAYNVVVSNNYGAVTSQVAVLTVAPLVAPDWLVFPLRNAASALCLQPDGKILFAGISPFTNDSGAYLGRINADGTLDPEFKPFSEAYVSCMALQPDRRILIGARFVSVARSQVARLNPDGSLDPTFRVDTDGNTIYCLQLLANGDILLAGDFSTVAGQPRNRVARLRPDGTVDATFDPAVDGARVNSVAEQFDGKLLIAGDFRNVAALPRNNLARLNPDGTVDTTFAPDPDRSVYCVVAQPDGKTLIGGEFTQLKGVVRSAIARLNPGGDVDTNFNAYAGGWYVASLALQTDGRIWAASASSLTRLLPDGRPDPTCTGTDSLTATALAIQANGDLLVSGYFNYILGQPRKYLARLTATGFKSETLSFDGRNVLWSRLGACPEVSQTSFEVSTNGTEWVSIGPGTPTLTGWQVTGLAYPSNSLIRARGFTSGANWNGSQWFVESQIAPLAIVGQPLSRTNMPGTLAVFSALANGTPMLSFHWYKDGAALVDNSTVTGSRTATLALTSVWGADRGNYSVIVSNLSGSITSEVARLEVVDPLIVTQPISLSTNAGNTVTLQVNAVGTSPLAYQWLKGFAAVEDGGNISGALSPSLAIANCSGFDKGNYAVVVSNAFGVVTSSVATLTVYDPFIASQPQSQLVTNGQTADFSVRAQGTGPFGYQWRKAGVDIPGATASFLSLQNVQWSDGGNYDVIVSNQFGAVYSRQAALSFLPTPRPSIAAANGAVFALAVQPDGGTLLGGNFSLVGGQGTYSLARITPDGLVDRTFNPRVGSSVYSICLQTDGSILVGGWFGSIGNEPHACIGRVYRDGSVDRSFTASANGAVYAIAVQPDGKILIGGAFTSVNGQSHNYLARLNADASLDPSFAAIVDGSISAVALQRDGKIVVGGSFMSLSGRNCYGIGRLNEDGTLETAFEASNDLPVSCITVQADGRILLGGRFFSAGGGPTRALTRLNNDGTPDTLFNATLDSGVYSLALQSDGRILVGGTFSYAGTEPRSHLLRLDADGTLDATFNPGANGNIYALALQSDGTIVMGGAFSSVAGQGATNLAKLGNTYSSIDSLALEGSVIRWTRGEAAAEVWRTTFEGSTNSLDWFFIGAGTRIPAGWRATAPLIGPSLTIRARGFNSSGESDGSSGIIEAGLGPPAISLQPADRTNNAMSLASFTVWAAGTAPLGYQWRGDGTNLLNAGQFSGVDTSTLIISSALASNNGGYSVVITNALGVVTSSVAHLFVIDPFISLQPVSRRTNAGTNISFAAQAMGTLPLTYQWLKDGLALQDGGNVSGAKTSALRLSNVLAADSGQYQAVISNYYGTVTSAVAVLDVIDPFIRTQPTNQFLNPGQDATFAVAATGTAPLTYQWRKDGLPLPGQTRSSITLTNVQGESVGAYDAIVSDPNGSITSSTAYLVVNLTVLDALNPGVDGSVVCFALQPDGGVLIGGAFNFVAGAPRTNIARIAPDGTLDPLFNPPIVNGIVRTLAVQTDNQILVGGTFSSVAGQPRTNLCRLNPNGTLDLSFKPGCGGPVSCLLVQPDGRILVGGSFSSLAGQPRTSIGRIFPDGTLDTNFTASATPYLYTMALQPDGKILLGGALTGVNGAPQQNLTRLTSDGILDSGFNARASSVVYCLAVQPDNRIVVAGQFTSLNGQPCTNIGRINQDGSLQSTFSPGADSTVSSLALQTDGRILVGGWFQNLGGLPRAHIGRLNADGTVDNSFNPGANSQVSALALQADGGILVGGSFTTLAGQPRTSFARLRNTAGANHVLGFDGSTVTWIRTGAGPEVWQCVFEASTNSAEWWNLGVSTRNSQGWVLSGGALPISATIRARGFVTGGGSQASTWFTEDRIALSQISPNIVTVDNFFGIHADQFSFHYAALPDQTVVVEASPDLVTWTSIATNLVGTSLSQFADPNPNWPRRFYRLRIGSQP